jgi:hypothetical protein
MYFWLCAIIVVIWAWLSGGSLVAAAQRRIGAVVAWLAVGVWTGLAVLALLFIGPYWISVYQVLLQPG